jgi:hypothetical protein
MENRELHQEITELYKKYFPRLGATYHVPYRLVELVPVSITLEDLDQGFSQARIWWNQLEVTGKVEPSEVPQFPAILAFAIEAARRREFSENTRKQFSLEEAQRRQEAIKSFRESTLGYDKEYKATPDGFIEEVSHARASD